MQTKCVSILSIRLYSGIKRRYIVVSKQECKGGMIFIFMRVRRRNTLTLTVQCRPEVA